MKKNSTKKKVELLRKRANARRDEFCMMKNAKDADVENHNAIELKELVYKQLVEV